MLVSKITRRGQVTIPKEIRESLGVGPSESVCFTPLGEGRVLISACNRPASDLFGLLKKRSRLRKDPMSLAEMDAVIKEQSLKTARGDAPP